MNKESNGRHIIFIIILISILVLSYCSIPLPESGKTIHKISKKAQTRIPSDKKETPVPKGELSSVKKPAKNEPDSIKAPSCDISVQSKIAKVEESKCESKTGKEEKDALPDIIMMNSSGYQKHTKRIVQFTHKNHVEKYSIACGRCHHDETGTPLDLTINDKPKGCIDCHKETEKPKGEKLEKKEKIARYHFEALHANCIECHKDYNREKGGAKARGPAPTSCTNCHSKK